MNATVHQLTIRNFKAFSRFEINLKGRHLLLYGPNGSGKSSLYWALYTFLQSARKRTEEVSRYFTPDDLEALLNVHVDPAASPGEICLSVREAASGKQTSYRIGKDAHDTQQQPPILKADLASDFITYRFFFRFSNFRNSQKFDIWPLFEREILPFCVSTSGGGSSPQEVWDGIKSGRANPFGYGGRAGANAYRQFAIRTEAFASMLGEIVDSITREAQAFYDKHFAKGDVARLELKCGLTTPPAYDRSRKAFSHPVIEFGVQIGGKTIPKPQTFLNEAKLTQLALSVRLAASLVTLQQSDLKLLVLDDLLISLDMDNRMRVVEILLSGSFANYQKVVLTHDLGFFQEFRRTVGASHPDWCFERLEGNPVEGVTHQTVKTELQKAEDYLHGHDLDEAAVCLRKAVEGVVQRFLKPTVVPTTEFVGLAARLRQARSKLLEKIPVRLYDRVLNETPVLQRGYLIPAGDADLDVLTELSPEDRYKLKGQRRKLRTLLKDEHWKAMENATLIDEVLKATERVLNPAAHGGQPPLHEAEVQHALDVVARLDKCLA